MAKRLTYYLSSLGCKVNSYEINALKPLLEKEGFTLCDDKSNADIAIINTCSVTATASQKSRQHIRKLKTDCPHAIIVVMGCYAQEKGSFITDSLDADIVIGTNNRSKIPELISDYLKNKKKQLAICDYKKKHTFEELSETGLQEHVRAYVKIEDGCNNFCSYCYIPYLRGRLRSRDKESILKEIDYNITNNRKEIVLTGIDTAGYGKDLVNYSFSDLLEDILKNEKLFRLRISSIEISEIDDHFLSLLKSNTHIARHLHVSLQSGSKSILQRMNRKYTPDEFFSVCVKLREAAPDIALTTDVIVGFPGETEEEFKETYDFIKKVNFAALHVFPYSPRPNTVASKMDNQISPKVKKERVKILLDLSKKLEQDYQKKFTGREVDVLVESYNSEKKTYEGLTSNYLRKEIKSDKDIIGEVIHTVY